MPVALGWFDGGIIERVAVDGVFVDRLAGLDIEELPAVRMESEKEKPPWMI